MRELTELIEAWDGLAVLARHDRPSGAWMFICIHDNTLGPSTGGTRMAEYASPADGLRDAMRLSEGMTHKWAAVDLGFGGAKAVIAVPGPMEGRERRELLERYARLLELLGGSFHTGEDLGTTSEDMAFLARHTRHIHGVDRDGRKIDPSPYTAHGVLTGIQTSLERVFGNPSPSGRLVLIQGVGNVGGHLARMLTARGALVSVFDVDRERARTAASEIGVTAFNDEDVYSATCDVFAPCAIGGILDESTIARLGCRIIAGSANNQLATPADAARLHDRGILYAPDFIINAGGAISFAHITRGLSDHDGLLDKVAGIGATLAEVYRDAEQVGGTTLEAASRMVERNLARGRRHEAASGQAD